ncbi:TcpE family conjugal transfer membrane protein [Alicyclobacillus fructus]|uniref:TcpE family conjugal transfer membrane protein n=1 Tax=Alicyclobacillus fructus TaxID=2816082 RepID=UPI001A8FBED6|nr:TcpE family conjugal transfer membrane protein [Alicyclobacillus fructus]
MPRTYQKLFRQKAVVTNIDRRIRLGFRLYWDDAFTFALAWILFFFLDIFTPYRLFNLFMNHWLVVTLSAVGFTWLARKLDPDGKSLVKYLYGFVAYPFRSHVSDGFVRKHRMLVWRRGKRTAFRAQARVWWTRGDLLLPTRVRTRFAEPWTFTNDVHVDVRIGRRQVAFQRARRFRWPSGRRISGLRPGVYEVSGRKVTRLDR